MTKELFSNVAGHSDAFTNMDSNARLLWLFIYKMSAMANFLAELNCGTKLRRLVPDGFKCDTK